MKTVKLSDFSPYDRNKGGIQELHHKIESKILQYWGEDSGILIGITPIYKRRLWSEEVKVVNNDKQHEADLALQSIWKHLAFSGFRDIEPNLSMTPGNEIMLEWNCSEMNANEIIDCMESAGYITPDDFIGVLD